MAFKSWNSFWAFTQKVKHGQRYIHDEEVVEFLAEVGRTSADRIKKIPKGRLFYRAQLGNDWRPVEHDGEVVYETPCPHDVSRMLPLKYQASEGRVNPKGIPHLYMATDLDTAMSEVRPWIGSNVSLAQLKITKDLEVIDCSLNHASNFTFYAEEPSDDQKEKAVWAMIDRAFSTPVVSNDSTADYVPTQIISEMFKSKGIDGIVYKSMLGDGFNVVAFDTASAVLLSCFLYEARSVKFDFQECANPYYIKRDKNA